MLLRSFKHFNDSVFRGPDDEGGGGAPVDDVTDVGGTDDSGDVDSGDGTIEEASKEPLTVREQIKKSMAEVNDDGQPKPEKTKREKKTGRFEAAPAAKDTAPADGQQEPAAPAAADDIPAPASLSPEAKAAWVNAPKEVKEAFVKREADMQRGVDELKQRYTQIDQALAPHTDALRQMNATPGQAVDRMFLWFKALSGTPASSFPALAQSMGIDWAKLTEATTQAQQQQPGGQQVQQQVEGNTGEGVPEIPAPVREYIGRLEQQIQRLGQGIQQVDGRFQSMEDQVQQQNMARTTENLNIWSKDKPHFEAVRTQMAELLQSGMIPLKPDGQVDLDKAYEHAIYFNPEVRAKVIAEQQQANQQVRQEAAQTATTAQQVQVDKARKASVSLPSTRPPGQGNPPQGTKKKSDAKLSVRDSLKAAVAELRDQ